MNKLDTSACSPVIGFPPKQGTWDFLQQAYTQPIAAIMQQLIGSTYSTSKIYLLYGCVLSVVGPTTFFTAGVVFCNGEIFLSPAQGIPTPTGGDTVVCNLLTSQYTTNADPVKFTDGVNRNVHNIRTIQFAAGASGSGTFNGGASADNDFSSLILVSGISEPASSITGAGLDGTTITLDKNNTYVRGGAASASNTITVDFTGARIGSTAVVAGFISAGNTITISADADFTTGDTTAPSSVAYCIIKVTYLGEQSGTTYVAINITYNV